MKPKQSKQRVKKVEAKDLLKREYLRGLIDGQKIKLTDNYTLKELNKHYKKYIKLNNPI